ncbi:MAG: hypothetical protein ABI830_11065 [Pseudolabrys sp.]
MRNGRDVGVLDAVGDILVDAVKIRDLILGLAYSDLNARLKVSLPRSKALAALTL